MLQPYFTGVLARAGMFFLLLLMRFCKFAMKKWNKMSKGTVGRDAGARYSTGIVKFELILTNYSHSMHNKHLAC